MIIKSFKFILLLSFLFSFILSQKNLEKVSFDGGQYTDEGYSSATYNILFSKAFDYIHVKVEFNGISPIVLLSNTDAQCKENLKKLNILNSILNKVIKNHMNLIFHELKTRIKDNKNKKKKKKIENY